MLKRIQIVIEFQLKDGREIGDFISEAEHELNNLMEDYGDENGVATAQEIH